MFLDETAFDVDDVDTGFSKVKINKAEPARPTTGNNRAADSGDGDEDGGGFGSAGALAPQASSRARMLAQQRELQAKRRASQMQNAGMVRSSRDTSGDNSPYERGGGTGDFQHTPAMPQFSAPKLNAAGGSGRHGPGAGDGGGGMSPDGPAPTRQSEFNRPTRPMSSSGGPPKGHAPAPPAGSRHGYRDQDDDDDDEDRGYGGGGGRGRGGRDSDRDRDRDRGGGRPARGDASYNSSGGRGGRGKYDDDDEDDAGYGRNNKGGGGGWDGRGAGGRGGRRADYDEDEYDRRRGGGGGGGGWDSRDKGRGGGADRDSRNAHRGGDNDRDRSRGAGQDGGRRKGSGGGEYDDDEDDYAINRGKQGGGGRGAGGSRRDPRQYDDEDDDRAAQGKGRGGGWEQGGGGDRRDAPRGGRDQRERESTPPLTQPAAAPVTGPAPTSALNLTNMRAFLTSPLPRGVGVVQCYIRRNKSGTNKLYPVYTLYLKDGDRFLLQSKKRANNKTSNYLVTMGENDFGRDSNNYLGKLRSNFVGTEFQVFDNGTTPKDGSAKDEGEERGGPNNNPRKELAAVMYAANVMGSRGPRKMQAAIPAVDEHDRAVMWRSGQGSGGGVDELINRIKDRNMRDIIYMINKPPRWNEQVGAYVLNFNGRVTMASVKNFQLVDPEDQNSVILQFGRVAKDEFTMDMQWPICPLQAFAITMSSFDSKIACD